MWTPNWECDKRKGKSPQYVRHATQPKFNMSKVNAWESLILVLKASSLHSIQFKVFDIDRDDVWDKLQELASAAVSALLGKATGQIPSSIPEGVSDSLGSAAEDLESAVLAKISRGNNLLFKGALDLTSSTSPHVIEGDGNEGKYKIEFVSSTSS